MYIVNRGEKDPVAVYMDGCIGFMRVVRATEGDYFQPRKICALPLVVRGLEIRGCKLKGVELLFVIAPSRIRAVFETAPAIFCRSCSENYCYTLRFELEISNGRDGEIKVSVLRVEYTRVEPPHV